jgi:hypothetical protein
MFAKFETALPWTFILGQKFETAVRVIISIAPASGQAPPRPCPLSRKS